MPAVVNRRAEKPKFVTAAAAGVNNALSFPLARKLLRVTKYEILGEMQWGANGNKDSRWSR
ncbi:MAG TPA: hypothetical protein VFM98_03950 [Ramlibacter sp.]|uniref:hypothetical protein n=1 Tax=Ramlibacter sp. TaxID=1917967 RepID=UPI002D7EDCAC|nr:hypothetical protein [Ramlibacter sp.]HET8744735.1 hypothetical protein [Ramlibacter sp.]